MLNDNIKRLRQARGISQEELALRLGVVRQTVSKWEKGISVPDAEMLMKLADYFGVSVGELLGTKIDTDADTTDIGRQLAKINEQFAIKNHRAGIIWRVIGIILAVIVVINILLFIISFVVFDRYKYDSYNVSETVQTQENTELIEETDRPSD